jgi:hypothetical protein
MLFLNGPLVEALFIVGMTFGQLDLTPKPDEAGPASMERAILLTQVPNRKERESNIHGVARQPSEAQDCHGDSTTKGLAIEFAADPHEELALALVHYGGVLAFGDDVVAYRRFAPPDWKEVLPREPVSIHGGGLALLIREPNRNSFVGQVRSTMSGEEGTGAEAYALFPTPFLDVLQAEIDRATQRTCGLSTASRVLVAFASNVPLSIRVVKVSCSIPPAGRGECH